MSRSPERKPRALACAAFAVFTLCVLTAPMAAVAAELGAKLGLGRPATADEIAAWDIDVRADGTGLPDGGGTAADGEAIFSDKCASCHGDFAEGVNRWTVLAGGRTTLKSENPVKTVGSFWPYIATAYDYIYRSMPLGNSQSLKPDEVYALIAYILLMNDIIEDESFEVSKETLAGMRLPNEENFVEDARPDTPTLSDGAPCMQDCKPEVAVTMRALSLDVTPEGEDGDGSKGSVE